MPFYVRATFLRAGNWLKSSKYLSWEPLESVASYRPMSLLSSVGKVFEKLLLRRLRALAEEDNLIPSHQFGFRPKYATIEQVQRVTTIIRDALKDKKFCPAVFLDVSQAFD